MGKELSRVSGCAGLTDKQVRFVLEYAVDYNGKAAAIAAGYSPKTAEVMASKLLKKVKVQKALERIQRHDQKEFEIQRHEILRHLASCATRDGKQFVDEFGRIIGSVIICSGKVQRGLRINDLPDDITRAIDGIKQKRKVITTEDGAVIEEIETEIKLVPKAQALDMCMKHKGLFAAEKTEQTIKLDWDSITQGNVIEVDPTDVILEEEQRKLGCS